MKIGKVDFLEPLIQYWNNPKQITTSVILFFLQFLFLLPIIGFFVAIFGVAGISGSEEQLLILVGCMYCFFWLIMMAGWVYIHGSAIGTYRQLNQKGELVLAPLSNLGAKFKNGLKYGLITIIYSLPFVFFFVLFFAFFIYAMNLADAGGGNVDEYASMMMILGMCLYFVAIAVMSIFQLVWRYVLTPVVYKMIVERRFFLALNPINLWNEFQVVKGDLLPVALSWFILGILWGIAYFVVYILSLMIVGIVLVPFLILTFIIIKMYIEPYYAYMGFKKVKEA
jgi:hypothetical protein